MIWMRVPMQSILLLMLHGAVKKRTIELRIFRGYSKYIKYYKENSKRIKSICNEMVRNDSLNQHWPLYKAHHSTDSNNWNYQCVSFPTSLKSLRLRDLLTFGDLWLPLNLWLPSLAFLSLTGPYWALLGLTGPPYWALLALTGSY